MCRFESLCGTRQNKTALWLVYMIYRHHKDAKNQVDGWTAELPELERFFWSQVSGSVVSKAVKGTLKGLTFVVTCQQETEQKQWARDVSVHVYTYLIRFSTIIM